MSSEVSSGTFLRSVGKCCVWVCLSAAALPGWPAASYRLHTTVMESSLLDATALPTHRCPPHCPQTEMPYEYYSMPFCKPPGGVKRSTSTINPGTILLGIRIENSPYNFTIMTKQQGLTVCNGEDYPDHAYPALKDKEVKVRGWVGRH